MTAFASTTKANVTERKKKCVHTTEKEERIRNGNQHGLNLFSYVCRVSTLQSLFIVHMHMCVCVSVDRVRLIFTYFTRNLPVIESHGHTHILEL